ncbi:hypothetical protein OG828_13215 [Streptomyces sp. NBC_00457]|uniref:hypothetical protein n=1 Tax=unclassified Streptomyces TaxID=2593676 RepID=UPI002E1A26AE|nr:MULTISPECIES: hypothetical protein [unclassified Streptomyces]
MTRASAGMGAAPASEPAHRGFHVLARVRGESDVDTLRLNADGQLFLDASRFGAPLHGTF